uniref:Uncharacterized protein n=1 Tax=Arundo donax TaxID=35708 RepID=A0A0A9H0D7_ARUDO
MDTMGAAPSRRSSAGVRSSPPKKGWMATRPARRTFLKEGASAA